jgi:NADPH:quinone reductase-like Zn-dependent oxidoreductase
MRAAQYKDYSSDLNTIKLVDNVTKPKARKGCALVKIAMAASNPIDFLVMEGKLKNNKWNVCNDAIVLGNFVCVHVRSSFISFVMSVVR